MEDSGLTTTMRIHFDLYIMMTLPGLANADVVGDVGRYQGMYGSAGQTFAGGQN